MANNALDMDFMPDVGIGMARAKKMDSESVPVREGQQNTPVKRRVSSVDGKITEDEVFDLIANGISHLKISESIGVGQASLCRWLSANPDRIARARECRKASAEAWMDKAEAVLMAIPKSATGAQITQAKELAYHYRKQAMIRNPAEYGDKIDVSGQINHQHSVANLIQSIGPTVLIGSSYQVEDAEIVTQTVTSAGCLDK